MHKRWEKEPERIEHADDAKITFTIALHGKHAWELLLEDKTRYHSISHGWASDDPRDWEAAIAPVLRQFFGSRLAALGMQETFVANGPEREHAPVAPSLSSLERPICRQD